MAWTSPSTVIAGQLMTAAFWNQQVRDNMLAVIGNTSTITTTGTQTALALPTGAGPLFLFVNNGSLLTVQGIAPGLDGQQLTIYAIGAGQIDLAHQNGSASAANRLINFATTMSTSLSPGSGSATYVYDATAARWRLRVHEQGAWIDYAGTSTVVGYSAITTGAIRYRLQGRSLTFEWLLDGTSNSTSLSLTVPANSVSTFSVAGGLAFDNGAYLSTTGRVDISNGSNVITIWATPAGSSGASWTASGQKLSRGLVTLEVA